MFTAGIIALVVIAWFAYRTHAEHLQARLQEANDRQYRIDHWTNDDSQEHLDMVLSFPEMRLVTKVRDRDGGYLADVRLMKLESWEENAKQLQLDGWTKDEWLRHGVQVFEVRRLPDGAWQTRLVFKYWKARVEKALEPEAFSADETLKGLTGLTRSQWRERGSFYNDDLRTWNSVREEFAPSIESSYQRYIHHSR